VLLVMLNSRIIISSSDESLGSIYSVFRVGDSLSLGGSTDELLSVLSDGDNRRSSSVTFCVLDHLGGAAF